MNGPVHTFVCLSLCPSHIYIYFVIVTSWDFQEKITFGKSDFQAKGQGQRRKVKVTHRGQSKILIQIWLRSDAQNFKWERRGARPIVFQEHLSNFKVTWPRNSAILPWCQYFWMIIPVSIHRWQIHDAQSFDGYSRDAILYFSRSSVPFQCSTGQKSPIWPDFSVSRG